MGFGVLPPFGVGVNVGVFVGIEVGDGVGVITVRDAEVPKTLQKEAVPSTWKVQAECGMEVARVNVELLPEEAGFGEKEQVSGQVEEPQLRVTKPLARLEQLPI